MALSTRENTVITTYFGSEFADYAEKNLAGWCISMLADDRINVRGPKKGLRVNEQFFDAHPEWHGVLALSPRVGA